MNCFRGSETSWVLYGSVCKQNRILPVGEQFLQVTHCDHGLLAEAAHGENMECRH